MSFRSRALRTLAKVGLIIANFPLPFLRPSVILRSWSGMTKKHNSRRTYLAIALAAVMVFTSAYPAYCSLMCEFGNCTQQSYQRDADNCHHHPSTSGSGFPLGSSCAKHGHSFNQLLPPHYQIQATMGLHLIGLVLPVVVRSYFCELSSQASRSQNSHDPPGKMSGRQVCLKDSFLRI
jgi:hypothetical protein